MKDFPTKDDIKQLKFMDLVSNEFVLGYIDFFINADSEDKSM